MGLLIKDLLHSVVAQLRALPFIPESNNLLLEVLTHHRVVGYLSLRQSLSHAC